MGATDVGESLEGHSAVGRGDVALGVHLGELLDADDAITCTPPRKIQDKDHSSRRAGGGSSAGGLSTRDRGAGGIIE